MRLKTRRKFQSPRKVEVESEGISFFLTRGLIHTPRPHVLKLQVQQKLMEAFQLEHRVIPTEIHMMSITV